LYIYNYGNTFGTKQEQSQALFLRPGRFGTEKITREQLRRWMRATAGWTAPPGVGFPTAPTRMSGDRLPPARRGISENRPDS
jgi:hypothetical protein